MMVTRVLYFLFVVAVFTINNVESNENCRQKRTNVPGQCKPLTSCPILTNSVQISNIANFLEEHGCGVEFETKDVLVCCPNIIAASGSVSSGFSDPEAENQPTCGSRKINQGAKWPFVVGIGYDVPLKELIAVLCNGVLINKEWVLTHAYCITEYRITHVFLKIGLAKYEDIVKIHVSQRRRPDYYDGIRDQNGIALIKLQTPVALSDDVQFACLPPERGYDPASPRYVLYIGKFDDGSVAGGFEVTEHMRNKVNLNECRRSSSISVFPTVDHLCTSGIRACNTALNRPILVGLKDDGGGYSILGVGGLYKDRCSSDVTLFTAVSSYLPYINSIISPKLANETLLETAGALLRFLIKSQNVFVCGRRVVGPGSHWPFIISLGSANPDGSNYISYCTGVLIETEWILTDALCVQSNKIELAYMGFNWRNDQAKTMAVDSIKFPPYFNSSYHHNSVALVKLPTKISYDANVQPGCLKHVGSFDNSPSLYALSSGYTYDSNGAMLGTGLKNIGRMSGTRCLGSLSVPFNAQDHSYICTTGIEACQFIANPPVLMEEETSGETFTVIGVGGDNTDFCNGEFMGYVRVKKHWPWILHTIYPGTPLNTLEVGIGTLLSSIPQAPFQNNSLLSSIRNGFRINQGLDQNINRPQNQGFSQNFPQNQGFNHNFPQNQGFKQKFPQNQGFNQNFPKNQGFNQNFPQNHGFNQNFPQNQGFNPNFPQNQGFNQNLPQNQDFRQNFPQTQDFNQNFARNPGFNQNFNTPTNQSLMSNFNSSSNSSQTSNFAPNRNINQATKQEFSNNRKNIPITFQ